jgi:hypothetical protein
MVILYERSAHGIRHHGIQVVLATLFSAFIGYGKYMYILPRVYSLYYCMRYNVYYVCIATLSVTILYGMYVV